VPGELLGHHENPGAAEPGIGRRPRPAGADLQRSVAGERAFLEVAAQCLVVIVGMVLVLAMGTELAGSRLRVRAH